MRWTDSASCCVVEPNVANSDGMDGGGVDAGAGGAAGSEADEAFGAERRTLSGLFSDRSFGAALTAVCRGFAGGTVDVVVATGGD